MKTRFTFAAYDPRGRTMAVKEGETVPLGWFISVGGGSPSEVTEATVVVGTTVDRSGGDGDEVLERHLSVETTAQSVAAEAAAVAAKVAAVAPAAAPISSSVNSVNLNDPWGSLSALKL